MICSAVGRRGWGHNRNCLSGSSPIRGVRGFVHHYFTSRSVSVMCEQGSQMDLRVYHPHSHPDKLPEADARASRVAREVISEDF